MNTGKIEAAPVTQSPSAENQIADALRIGRWPVEFAPEFIRAGLTYQGVLGQLLQASGAVQ